VLTILVITQVISLLNYSETFQTINITADGEYRLCLNELREDKLIVVLADSRPCGTPTPTHTPVTDTCQQTQYNCHHTDNGSAPFCLIPFRLIPIPNPNPNLDPNPNPWRMGIRQNGKTPLTTY